MKKIMVIAMVLAAAWPAAAKVIISCDSTPVEVELRSGVKYEWATNVAKTCIGGMAKADYMFTDWAGLYANFDWRLGGETSFDCGDAGEVSLDMSGWYWGVGIVISF